MYVFLYLNCSLYIVISSYVASPNCFFSLCLIKSHCTYRLHLLYLFFCWWPWSSDSQPSSCCDLLNTVSHVVVVPIHKYGLEYFGKFCCHFIIVILLLLGIIMYSLEIKVCQRVVFHRFENCWCGDWLHNLDTRNKLQISVICFL